MKKRLLHAQGLTKQFTYPQVFNVLKDINFELYEGDSVAIMGASGEGKSTLLHILGSLEPPSQGILSVCDIPVSTANSSFIRLHHIGFVFQSYHLMADYTVLRNVLMPALIAKKDIQEGSPAYRRAQQLLEHVGLGSRQHFLTKLLSGGEKQRVAIARALMNNPEILMADEPSGNLDHHTSKEIHQLLTDTTRLQNKGLIVVTHDQDLAELCDHLFILKEGMLHKKVN